MGQIYFNYNVPGLDCVVANAMLGVPAWSFLFPMLS